MKQNDVHADAERIGNLILQARHNLVEMEVREAERRNTTYEGVSEDGTVAVTVNGDITVQGVRIDHPALSRDVADAIARSFVEAMGKIHADSAGHPH